MMQLKQWEKSRKDLLADPAQSWSWLRHVEHVGLVAGAALSGQTADRLKHFSCHNTATCVTTTFSKAGF